MKVLAILVAVSALPLALGLISGFIDYDVRDDFWGGFKKGATYAGLVELVMGALIGSFILAAALWRA